MPYKAGDFWMIRVPQRNAEGVRKSTGTTSKSIAKEMEAMASDLARRLEWELLEAVTGGDRRRIGERTRGAITLKELFAAYSQRRTGGLDELKARLRDTDLEPLVAEWYKGLTGSSAKVARDTADHYLHSVRLLIEEDKPFPSSQLTPRRLQGWLDTMEGVEPGTVRKRGMAMRRFTKWLVKPMGVLDADPMRSVELPSQGKPRDKFLDTPDAIELADAQPEPYRTLSALLAGTGIEVSVSLDLTRADVFMDTKEIRARGTKTHNRDRIVRVAEWAWPYIEARCKNLLPKARLFADIPDRWTAGDYHVEARDKLAEANATFEGYTMRDARHTWAVRAVRSGWPIEAVSRQLGHKDGTLALKVYGKFVPQSSERDRWEKMAAERDAELKKQREREKEATA